MKLISEFKNGAVLDAAFCAHSSKSSPFLEWFDVPDTVKSFAVTMHDPDAPTGGAGWWHWFVANIPATQTSLEADAGKNAIFTTLRNDGGEKSYMGCLPPEGDPPHRYIFTVYALDIDFLDLENAPSTSLAGFLVNQHCIAKASICGFFAR